MKDSKKDLLKAIEEDFLDDEAVRDYGSAEEFDHTGLKRWEIAFLRRSRFN